MSKHRDIVVLGKPGFYVAWRRGDKEAERRMRRRLERGESYWEAGDRAWSRAGWECQVNKVDRERGLIWIGEDPPIPIHLAVRA